jgi:hypothetical protein
MHKTPYGPCLVAVLAALLLATVPTLAQKVSDVERRYQAALHFEQVEGNLTAARKAYEGLAATTNGTAEIRLKALVRQAGIHDTLGLVSDDHYQRVIREFPTRPEAAVAQRKLAARQELDAAQRKLDAGQWKFAARQTPGPVAGLAQPLTNVRTRSAFFVALLDGSGRLGAWEPRVLENATVTSYVQIAPDNQHVVYSTG